MNQAVNTSPSLKSLLVLLGIVAGLAGVGALGIYRLVGSLEETAPDVGDIGKLRNPPKGSASNKELQNEPGAIGLGMPTSKGLFEKATPVESAGGPRIDGRFEGLKFPTVVLPEFAVPLDPGQFEIECERFVNELETQLPENPLALNVVAMYYSQMQQTTKADDLWRRCVQLAPNDPVYYLNWATNYLNRSESEEALVVLEQAIANGLDPGKFTYQKAIALAALSRDSEVEDLILSDLRQQPRSSDDAAPLMLLLGQSQIKLGKIQEALKSFQAARAGGIYNKAVVNGLLTCSVRLKDKEAIDILRKELESFATEQEEFGQQRFDKRSEVEMRRFGLGIIGESIEVLRRAGDLRWAEAVGLRAVFLDPKNLDVYRLLAGVYRNKAEPQNEMVVYERICKLEPTDPLNYLLYARAAADAGHVEKAEGIIKHTIAMAPLDPACFAAMGEFLLEQGRPQDAAWYLRQAIAIDPSREGRLLYIQALKGAGEYSAASEQESILHSTQDVPRVRANQ
jgi:tetratricopeptide (TPR) repeat protein